MLLGDTPQGSTRSRARRLAMNATHGQGGPVLIKKYGNRRLYDTVQSRYITLDDLAAIIRSGAAIKVVEASTERDLTRQVLTQVILERQEALEMFPIELLLSIIRVQGTLEQAPFAAFLGAATRQFIQHGSLWTQQMAAFLGAFAPGFMPMTSAPQPQAAPQPPRAEPSEPEPEPPPGEPEPAPASDLRDLRQRMDALLGKLGRE
jgi:polyhydroxyalkanoate synthesis repressor PhaR